MSDKEHERLTILRVVSDGLTRYEHVFAEFRARTGAREDVAASAAFAVQVQELIQEGLLAARIVVPPDGEPPATELRMSEAGRARVMGAGGGKPGARP